MKRVLITGGSGFCAGHLAHLLAQSKNKIFLTYRISKPESLSSPSSSFFRCSLENRRQVLELIKEIRPDEVYHLAALSSPSESWKKESETYATNIGGTIHLLDALRRFSPRARLLLASSVHVYGRTLSQGRRVREDSLLFPVHPYGVSKALAELACRQFAVSTDLCIVIARAVNHFGAGQRPDFVFSDWCRQMAIAEAGRGPAELHVGDLGLERDFLHVEDVVSAYRLLMRRGRSGWVYNVSSGTCVSLRRAAHFLLAQAGRKIKMIQDRSRFRVRDVKKITVENSRLRRLGWRPRVPVEEGLLELLEDWRRRVREGLSRVR